MNISRALFLLLAFASLLALAQPSQAQQKKKEQYVITLKPAPRLLGEANWTEKDNRAVSEHFQRLKELTQAGTVILAGRTLNTDASQFGTVIVEVENEAEARAIMEGDPAVMSGVMTATMLPFQVALMRPAKTK